MDTRTEQAALRRLARVEGQVKGLQRMVKDRRYCIEIIQQVAASKKALEQVGLLIMRNHIDTCVSKSIRAQAGEEKVAELMQTIHRFIR
jgi:DNA-binding FrmR family transcriptional regulator